MKCAGIIAKHVDPRSRAIVSELCDWLAAHGKGVVLDRETVITSYSIHYTKLYDPPCHLAANHDDREVPLMPRIVRFYETGEAEVLKIDEMEAAEPGKGEVRLKVEAIGLKRAEIMYRRGQYLV